MEARNALYDRGILEVHDLGARTISIGNLTTGGTGKTPLVASVAALLAERGEKVCVLTRGYARQEPKKRILVSDGENILSDPRKTGDEPLELAYKLHGKAIVIADADRVSAGEWAERRFGVTAFVLDDGFQHRRVRRDVDIVCIDATRRLGEMQMLPGGHLRERLSGLSRADVVAITRADLVDRETISDLKVEISTLANAPVFEASNKLAEPLQPGSYFAFCGVGNPESFFKLLRNAGLNLAGIRSFPDHHGYTGDDLAAIEMEARSVGAESLITTAKDHVKIARFDWNIPLLVGRVDVELNDPMTFESLL